MVTSPFGPALRSLSLMLLVAGLTVGLLLTSCAKPSGQVSSTNTVPVVGQVPTIPLPEKPVLQGLEESELVEYNKLSDGLKQKLVSNDKKLKTYALQLVVSIEDFNDYAAVRNAKSNASLNVKGSK
jgi:hypothetical protein